MTPKELMAAIPCSKARLMSLLMAMNEYPMSGAYGAYLKSKYSESRGNEAKLSIKEIIVVDGNGKQLHVTGFHRYGGVQIIANLMIPELILSDLFSNLKITKSTITDEEICDFEMMLAKTRGPKVDEIIEKTI